ncbi:MAG: DUF4843 domain-containing protein [Prevotella sp.]
MKQIHVTVTMTMFLALLLTACEKEEIPSFSGEPGIFLEGTSYSYSFMQDPAKDEKTINLSASISGTAQDRVRTFRVEVVPEETTAPAESYEIGEGIVEPGKFQGTLPVKLRKSEALNTEIYDLAVKLVPTADFPEVRLLQTVYVISFTAKIIKPTNWDTWLKDFFGEYSTRWWTMIMEWTGLSSLPYDPTNADRETWWMGYYDILAYKRLVVKKLAEYNEQHPNDPLTHDDGVMAGQPVTMP